MSVAPVAEAAGMVAWTIAKTGLLDTTLPVRDGVGEMLVATSPALASLGTGVPLELLHPLREPDIGYDWRMNSKDLRFQFLSCVPFGLLFIAVALQRTKRTELRQEDEECEIVALAGLMPPERCRPTVAMAAVTDLRDVVA
jgi:hypothetical protein